MFARISPWWLLGAPVLILAAYVTVLVVPVVVKEVVPAVVKAVVEAL